MSPDQFLEQFMLEYDEAKLAEERGISRSKLAKHYNGTWLPFIHDSKVGEVRVCFKYYSKIADNEDIMPVNRGATFIAIQPDPETGKAMHAMFVYGVDEDTKSYICLDSLKKNRDNPANYTIIDGVKRPTMKVPWWSFKPHSNRTTPNQLVIC